MLIKAKTLTGYKLDCIDGSIGHVKEFYFDDEHWAIRYLVADSGTWLTGRQVLISPYALVTVNTEGRSISVNLTKKQIEESPSLYTDKPVSRQFEENYYGYYGWPVYWGGPYMWGASPYIVPEPGSTMETNLGGKELDPHLRSTHDVDGHRIHATDGDIGHCDDFIIDDHNWAIRYLVIDTQDWWPGKKVLVAPQWIERVSWSEAAVFINVSCDTIKLAPEYTDGSLLTRDYEIALFRHYNSQGYWGTPISAVTGTHVPHEVATFRHTYATFVNPEMAEKAGGALLDHGIKPEHISILFPEHYGSRTPVNPEGENLMEQIAKSGVTTTTVGDAVSGSTTGASIGLAAGTLAALASVFIPGVGLVLGGGALALAIGGMVGSTAAGIVAGGVTGFLKDQGVPTQAVEVYGTVLGSGGAIVTVSPTDETTDNAVIESILRKYDGQISTYDLSKSAVVNIETVSTGPKIIAG